MQNSFHNPKSNGKSRGKVVAEGLRQSQEYREEQELMRFVFPVDPILLLQTCSFFLLLVDLPNHRLYLIKSFDNLVWLVHALRPSSYVPWGFALEFIARGMVNSYLRGDFFCISQFQCNLLSWLYLVQNCCFVQLPPIILLHV